MLERLASRNIEVYEYKGIDISTSYAFEVHERSSILVVRILAYFTWRRRAAPVPSEIC